MISAPYDCLAELLGYSDGDDEGSFPVVRLLMPRRRRQRLRSGSDTDVSREVLEVSARAEAKGGDSAAGEPVSTSARLSSRAFRSSAASDVL